jgi:hypothetical protein
MAGILKGKGSRSILLHILVIYCRQLAKGVQHEQSGIRGNVSSAKKLPILKTLDSEFESGSKSVEEQEAYRSRQHRHGDRRRDEGAGETEKNKSSRHAGVNWIFLCGRYVFLNIIR